MIYISYDDIFDGIPFRVPVCMVIGQDDILTIEAMGNTIATMDDIMPDGEFAVVYPDEGTEIEPGEYTYKLIGDDEVKACGILRVTAEALEFEEMEQNIQYDEYRN